jgi:integrase/recombinase XerD
MSAAWIEDEGRLFTAEGLRKYVVASEARRLLAAADLADRETRLFCRLLYYTGCRISEGLALTPARLDAEGGRIIFRTLKRRKLVYRGVPAPADLIRDLAALAVERQSNERLFPWCRQTGWRRIKSLFQSASIAGPQATPRGLRHHLGVHASGMKIPESTIGKWLGHASLKSTRIYTAAVGAEERALARRMWRGR